VEILADRLGVPPETIVTDDVVKQIRDQRAQQQSQMQQQQQQMQGITAASQAAKNLGQTPVGGSNALDQLINGQSGNSQAA
jgi:transcription initiation factor TFIID subunit TAF12